MAKEGTQAGFLRDAFGRLVVTGALSVAALAEGEKMRGGFVRDKQRRLVVVGPEGQPIGSGAPVVNVKVAGGAKGDGATNDTAAITAAIAALPGGTTPKVLYFPAGVYRVTPAAPTFTLPAGTIVQGEGWSVTSIKSVEEPATEQTRFFDIAGGRVEFRNIDFAGPTVFGGKKILQAIRATNTAGIEVFLQNCACHGVNRLWQGFSGVSQLIEAVDCVFDGMDIGNPAGQNQDQSTCILAPNVGPGVILRNVRFRRWGSSTAGGTNLNHALYLTEHTALQVDNCKFEEHRDGRYIQVNGASEGAPAAGEYWAVRNSFFGVQTVANIAVQTTPLIFGIIADCQFTTAKNSINPLGSCQITGCVFRGGLAGTFNTIVVNQPNIKLEIRDCRFMGKVSIDVYIESTGCEVDVQGCSFLQSSSYANLCFGEAATTGTVVRLRDNYIEPAAGVPGIRTEAGTVASLTCSGNTFQNGKYGIQISAGTTSTMNLIGNVFAGQTTAALLKTGIVTSENLRANVGGGLINTL